MYHICILSHTQLSFYTSISVVFLNISADCSKKKIKICLQCIRNNKILRNNFNKLVRLVHLKLKSVIKSIKKTKWRNTSCSWIGKSNINVVLLPIWTNTSYITIQVSFCVCKNWQPDPKIVYNFSRTKISITVLEKRVKLRD